MHNVTRTNRTGVSECRGGRPDRSKQNPTDSFTSTGRHTRGDERTKKTKNNTGGKSATIRKSCMYLFNIHPLSASAFVTGTYDTASYSQVKKSNLNPPPPPLARCLLNMQGQNRPRTSFVTLHCLLGRGTSAKTHDGFSPMSRKHT